MHAPRQTGKTSALMAMMRRLNEEGFYACAYTNIEAAQVARNDVEQGIATVCSVASGDIAQYLKRPELNQWFLNESKQYPPQNRLSNYVVGFKIDSGTVDKHGLRRGSDADARRPLVGAGLVGVPGSITSSRIWTGLWRLVVALVCTRHAAVSVSDAHS